MFCVAKLALAGAASVALPRHLVEPAAVRIAEPVHLQETKRKKNRQRRGSPARGSARRMGSATRCTGWPSRGFTIHN